LTELGVVAALGVEARALGPISRSGRTADGFLICVSGIGDAAAALAARSLIDSGASALMTFGLAGGLDPMLRAGSIVLPAEVLTLDGRRYPTSAVWRERLMMLMRPQRAVETGNVLSSTVAIETVAAKAAAFRDTGAVAVDMESAAVAEVAAAQRLPFIAVRVIVDTAADALPRAVAAASRAGRVQIGRLIAGLAMAPVEIAALLRLTLRYRAAMQSLKAVARVGVAPS
jgi:adenosylhomocysteine nucleosidase